MSSATCCVACVKLEAVLDVRCQGREDGVERSGCRSDSAVLKGAATSIKLASCTELDLVLKCSDNEIIVDQSGEWSTCTKIDILCTEMV